MEGIREKSFHKRNCLPIDHVISKRALKIKGNKRKRDLGPDKQFRGKNALASESDSECC